jgi:hypothetical protein
MGMSLRLSLCELDTGSNYLIFLFFNYLKTIVYAAVKLHDLPFGYLGPLAPWF